MDQIEVDVGVGAGGALRPRDPEPSRGAIAPARGSIRRCSTLARVTKARITSRLRPVRDRNETPSGSGAIAVSSVSSAVGALSTRTRAPSRMPSFFHSGVPE